VAFLVDVDTNRGLSDFANVAHLVAAVQALQMEAQAVVPRLRGRTLWMVNSTAQGGGVAEMLPTMITLLRDLGIQTEWAVIESTEPRFFALTKRIHNLIHGEGDPGLDADDRRLFEAVNRENAAFLKSRVQPGDVLIVHDPQPIPLASILKEELDVLTVWRCHIGLDDETPATQAAWEFLRPYVDAYEHTIFSAPDYVPSFCAGHATVIHPGIDPLSHKNRELGLHRTVGILSNSGMAVAPGPLVTGPYKAQAQRLSPDGQFRPAGESADFGLLTRPIVTQISRWDRLKGFEPLLEAFSQYKTRLFAGGWSADPAHRIRQELVRLVLAGPDPGSVQDDPEALEVLADIQGRYAALDPQVQETIAVFALPMESITENALMVNALQRASSIVVQNSLREGFGLTIAEAMWKRVPILSNDQACGPRQQVRDTVDGRMIDDPTDPAALTATLDKMLTDVPNRAVWARNAQRHVHDKFLVFAQLCEWMRLFGRRSGAHAVVPG
jgi:trehalose synthase